MICVFDAGNTNYTGNGDAVLQPKECKVKNIAGGNYDLTMTHPIDAAGKWTHLKPGAVIRVPVPREEIENAYAGEDVDVYKTTAEAALREGPSEPTTITYPGWSQYNTYSPGSKVSSGGKNYECTYFDQNSPMRAQSPGASSWWREIARTTSGAAALVTLPTGTELYWIEDYDSIWAKLSTFYGIVGYIKKEQIRYDRHLDPEETQPRIITTQLFRVEKQTVDTKSHTVSVNAKHVSYDLNGVLVRDVKISQASPAMALGRITAGFMMDYAGTIATNLKASENGTYTQDIKGKNGMFALLDPDKGIVSTFNAAFRRDNWDLFIMKRVDTDRGYRIKHRKNMLGVNWAEDNSGLVTRVVPVAKDEKGEDLYLPETWIDSSRIGDYQVVKMERLTVKGQVGKDKGLGDDSKWTLEDLLDEMRTKARERFTVDMADRVNSTVTVDFEQVGDTEEYKEYKNLGTVLLYDTVRVENDEISLGMNLYVSEWEWDAIREKMLAVKLVNTTKYAKGTVTGYNVQAKSIGSDKLSDDVTGEIMRQVEDIIPEYTDPEAARPGIVTVTDSDPTLSWGTRSKVGEVSGTGLHVTMPDNPIDGLGTDTATPTDSDYTIKVGSPSKKITFAKVWAYIKSKLGISGSGSTAKYLDQQGNWTEPPGTYSLPTASSSTKGGIKTGYTQSGKNYPVQMSGENAYVNVPWTDTQYSLPLAGNGTRGGVQTGYTQNGRNYPVQMSGENAYVNVPWTDNDHYDWGDITNKPATATRWPAWGEVTGKPNRAGSPSDGGDANSARAVRTYGGDVQLGTTGTSSNDSGDIIFLYGNGTEKSRIYSDNTYASGIGPNYRVYNASGTLLYSGRLVIANEAIKSISRSGTTFTATRADGTTFTFTQQDENTWRPVQDNLTSDSATDSLSAKQGKELQNNKVAKAGDTMTGQLKTSFKDSVAMGSYGAAATTIQALVEELRYSSGCSGSASIAQAYGNIPAGWYNFTYMPHRSGGLNGGGNGDNHLFGNLLLCGMTVASRAFIIRITSGAIAEVSHNLYEDQVGLKVWDIGTFNNAGAAITIPNSRQMILVINGANSNDNGMFLLTENSSGTTITLFEIKKGSGITVSTASGNQLRISTTTSNTAHAYGLILQ